MFHSTQAIFLNSSANVLAVDKVTDYSKGLLIYESDVTLGLSPIPFQAPKQTEIPFSYNFSSSSFTFLSWPLGELRCPYDNIKGLKSGSFFSAGKRRKEVQIAFKMSPSHRS